MRIDPLERESQSSNLNAVEFNFMTGFQGWHDIKESPWRSPSPPSVATGIPTDISAFYIPNSVGRPPPLPSAPFHFTVWMTHLFDVKRITWEEKGRKRASQREKTWENFKFGNVEHVLHMNLLHEIITTSVTVVSHAVLLYFGSQFETPLSPAYFLLVTYLTWLKRLKTILCVLENFPCA